MPRKKNSESNDTKNPDIEKWREEKAKERRREVERERRARMTDEEKAERRRKASEWFHANKSKTGRRNAPANRHATDEERKAWKREYARRYYRKNRVRYLGLQKQYRDRRTDEQRAHLREGNRLRQRKRVAKERALNEANVNAIKEMSPLYNHSQLMQMPPEKLARLIDSKNFQMASVR